MKILRKVHGLVTEQGVWNKLCKTPDMVADVRRRLHWLEHESEWNKQGWLGKCFKASQKVKA